MAESVPKTEPVDSAPRGYNGTQEFYITRSSRGYWIIRVGWNNLRPWKQVAARRSRLFALIEAWWRTRP